ncbi:hypothetical protein [Aureisphaera sp.]
MIESLKELSILEAGHHIAVNDQICISITSGVLSTIPSIDIHFPPVAKKYPFRGKGIYKITGKVVEEFDFLTIEASKLERMNYIPDPRFDTSFDAKAVKRPSLLLSRN